jgi:hypothetical protein
MIKNRILPRDYDFAVADWIDYDLRSDRNWHSRIPEWLGSDPFTWPVGALFDYLAVNGKKSECKADVLAGRFG